MRIEQIYTGCLAQGAYYIESEGEAVIIDPLREVTPYLRKLEREGDTLKYIFETHFHADFVSGHIDLAKTTGATIVYGPTAQTSYDIHEAKDGEFFEIGKVKLKVLHTPGHTMESSTYLLIDEEGKDHAIFSGDTLFIGDVGRPDLAIKSDLTREDLAAMLYDSLRNKIMPLANDVLVYPAHGAGSACGKNMSSDTWDTLGHQKQTNYALRSDMTKDEFVKEVTEGILPAPQYFAKNAMINKTGYANIDEVLTRGSNAFVPEDFEAIVNEEGALVIDARDQHDFARAHIPNSIFIGLDGSFATWVGTLITDIHQPILLITYPGKEEEAVTRLARVGYDHTLGYLKGGFEAWEQAGKEVNSVTAISAVDLAAKIKREEPLTLLDVRKPGEYAADHAEVAISSPLDYINDHMNTLDKSETYHVHCLSGYRSMVFSSILKSRGYTNIVDVDGGYDAIVETSIPMTDFVCPSQVKSPTA
jgi:glyoxylase-like metal-dependent hydrolase (beta-lactamase superfamily II)/rhodanese-related sulfurtransferase